MNTWKTGCYEQKPDIQIGDIIIDDVAYMYEKKVTSIVLSFMDKWILTTNPDRVYDLHIKSDDGFYSLCPYGKSILRGKQ